MFGADMAGALMIDGWPCRLTDVSVRMRLTTGRLDFSFPSTKGGKNCMCMPAESIAGAVRGEASYGGTSGTAGRGIVGGAFWALRTWIRRPLANAPLKSPLFNNENKLWFWPFSSPKSITLFRVGLMATALLNDASTLRIGLLMRPIGLVPAVILDLRRRFILGLAFVLT